MSDPQERVEELEEALHATYTMLDRYANEVSDEAYRAIEGEIIQKTDPDLAKAHKHPLEAEVERLQKGLLKLATAPIFGTQPTSSSVKMKMYARQLLAGPENPRSEWKNALDREEDDQDA